MKVKVLTQPDSYSEDNYGKKAQLTPASLSIDMTDSSFHLASPSTIDLNQQPNQQIINEILHTLTLPQKELNSKYLYDSSGLDLFYRICQLPEYYLYEQETSLLANAAQLLAGKFYSEIDLVEFGAGSAIKAQYLLDKLPRIKTYHPIDLITAQINARLETFTQRYPQLEIVPLEADITQKLKLPKLSHSIKLGLFTGSIIGNLSNSDALDFLNQVRRILGKGSYLLIGVDNKKPASILHLAYNDPNGLTQAFNLNILTHLNRLTGSDFDITQFEHYAFYNPERSRVEMHLVSRCEQVVNIDGHNIYFAEGESIHTENAYKFTKQTFSHLAAKAGWQINESWHSDNSHYSLYLLVTK
ncbi:L-histidine N(alpha)-methyltransferase [Catenovulum sp. 2E275]|uniref:L-histidine N(alpha)-methyltransferase n=1 Tax=Catenovulum sp. 2E275 TaxID=2980497 RepID=UPI0021D3A419|nr:L-histidine N(alpha)-methyltransferase [Catenovulum sp. 2E275]MCU4674523.1 L-histidine N(alpha)-methyltransferase [Catenovulum sp. 2E275]